MGDPKSMSSKMPRSSGSGLVEVGAQGEINKGASINRLGFGGAGGGVYITV